MAECKSGSNTYLHYKCYDYLKPKFDVIDLGYYAREYLAEARKIIKERYINIEPYDIFFNNITSYLKYDDLSYHAGVRIPCRYINYLLYEKVRERNMHLSNPDYRILKDFVKEFHKCKGSRDGDICSSEINLLDYDEHRKMKLLYNLYDDYKSIVDPPKNKPEKYNPCDILSKIISSYNDTINNNQEPDDDLINKLIELKKLIDINVLPKNKACKKEITHFNLSEKEKLDIEEAKRIKREEEERLEQAKLEQAKLEQAKLEQAKLGQAQLGRVELSGHFQTRPVRHESNEQGQEYQTPNIPDTLLSYNKESGLAESYNDLQTFGESGHSGIKMEQAQDPGLLGQMQNAFTTIVQNVDPAPVLGVSGGMGVLFLLFKYTPVGSFFGGRRGRIRQIPSSFRGFPPGDFANFQEYDGGLIGYSPMSISSLAE
ncbi:PIR protein [Plasmodium vivax]|nr:PIR protein [Plasmodium vivax]